MPKYIGSEAPYGLHEKQLLEIQQGKTDFALNYKVGYPTSILVVYHFAGASKILEPGEDYVLIEGGTKIRIAFETYNSDAYEERLYVIYLGKQLSIPVPLEKQPVLIQKTGIVDVTIPITEDVVLHPAGLLIFKNGVLLRHNFDYTIAVTGDQIILNAAAVQTDRFDIHVISGLQRSTLVPIADNSITTEQLKQKSVTNNKLDLRYVSYNLAANNIIGLGSLQTSNTAVLESTYMILGNTSNLNGAPVRVRVKFNTILTGARDSIVRFSLPALLPSNSTLIGGNVTITNGSSIESGILTWGAIDAVDIRRQFGVTFDLGLHTFEASFEYIAKE
jgi:hypothetical protein